MVLYGINTEKIMKEGRKLSCADVEDVFFCIMVYLSSVKVNTFSLSFDLFIFFRAVCVSAKRYNYFVLFFRDI